MFHHGRKELFKRQLFKIGVNFDSESRSLSEWLVG